MNSKTNNAIATMMSSVLLPIVGAPPSGVVPLPEELVVLSSFVGVGKAGVVGVTDSHLF